MDQCRRFVGKPPDLQLRNVPVLPFLGLLATLVFSVFLTACSESVLPPTVKAPSPQVILERAFASTKEQVSYCFTYEYKAEVLNATRTHDTAGERPWTTRESVREDIESVTRGKFRAPSRLETTEVRPSQRLMRHLQSAATRSLSALRCIRESPGLVSGR